jgi:hypothetical protein
MERLDALANRPAIMDYTAPGSGVPKHKVAIGQALTPAFDSHFCEKFAGTGAGNSHWCIPQTLATNDAAEGTGIHRTGATKEELSTPQMVSSYETCDVGDDMELCWRQAGTQSEFCDYGAKGKAAIRRRLYIEEALQDGALHGWRVRLNRTAEPNFVPASFSARLTLEEDWPAKVASLSADWMQTEACVDGVNWLLVPTAPPKGEAARLQRVLDMFDARRLDALQSWLRHLAPGSWRKGSCDDAGSAHLRLSPAAIVVLASGANFALDEPTAYTTGGESFSTAGRNDLTFLVQSLCGRGAAHASGVDGTCADLFKAGLRYRYTEPLPEHLALDFVAGRARTAVTTAAKAIALNQGPEVCTFIPLVGCNPFLGALPVCMCLQLVLFRSAVDHYGLRAQLVQLRCTLDNSLAGCGEFKASGATQLLECGNPGELACTKASTLQAAVQISQAVASIAILDARRGGDLRCGVSRMVSQTF